MNCNLTCAEYESKSTRSDLGFLQLTKTMQNHGRSAVWKVTGLREALSAICTFRCIALPGHLIPLSIRGWQGRAGLAGQGMGVVLPGLLCPRAGLRLWAAVVLASPRPQQEPSQPSAQHSPLEHSPGHSGAWGTSQGRFALWRGNGWFLPGSCSLYVF